MLMMSSNPFDIEELPILSDDEILDILASYFQQSALVHRTSHPSWF